MAVISADAALTVDSTLPADAMVTALATASLTAEGTLTTTGALQWDGDVVLVSDTTLATAGTLARTGVIALTGESTLTTAAVDTVLASAALTSAATLTTAGSGIGVVRGVSPINVGSSSAASFILIYATTGSANFAVGSGCASTTVTSTLACLPVIFDLQSNSEAISATVTGGLSVTVGLHSFVAVPPVGQLGADIHLRADAFSVVSTTGYLFIDAGPYDATAFSVPRPPSVSYIPQNEPSKILTAPQYVYLTVDIKTNAVLAELPFQNVTFERKLNAAGTASMNLAINPTTEALNAKACTTPGRTALYIMRNGVPVWGGIIWKRAYTNDRMVKFECQTFESYFFHRFLYDVISSDTFGTDGDDQLSIAQAIANQVASGALIDVDVATSGVLRFWTGFYWEYKTSGEAIDSISSLFDGFDWNVFIYTDYQTGDFKRHLAWGYPYLGVMQSDSNLAFTFPGNIKTYSTTEDADKAGTNIFSIGGGEGLDQIVSPSVSDQLLWDGWPQLDYSVSYKDTFNPDLLDAKAVLDRQKYKAPVTILSVTVAAGAAPELGTYNPGDWARFIIQDNWNSPAIDQYFRITAVSCSISDDGSPEAVTLEIGGLGTTT